MAFTYDVSTNRGKVRMLTPDSSATSYVFEDDEIDAFLALEGNDVRRGAALALETLASNEALVLKVIKVLDLQTDGAKTADALLKRAALLRGQADTAEAAGGELFDWAEMVVDPFSARERLASQMLRGAI
jgi:hypothetical protein